MKLNKEILITLAVIILTAFNIYRVEIPIPPANSTLDPQDIAFTDYIYKFHYFICIYMIGMIGCYVSGIINRVIKGMCIMQACVFVIIIIKLLFDIPNKTARLDITIYGVFAIITFYYLIHPYLMDILIFAKNLTNQIYMRWPNKKKKHGRSE